MNNVKTKLLPIIIALAFALSSHAFDVKDFTFTHVGIQEGMQSQRVYSICQTTDGAVWWTTKRGVSRANGSIIRNYELDENALYSSFAGRKVQFAKTQESNISEANLYAYDNRGRIFKFNKIQNRFDKVADISTLLSPEIVLNDVLITDEGYWLAMREGIFYVKDEKVLTAKKGVYANCFIPHLVSSSAKDGVGDGLVLVGTNEGVYSIAQSGSSEKFSTTKLSNENTESAYFDVKNKKLWLGTYNEGIVVWDVKANGANLKANKGVKIAGVPHNPIRSITPYDDSVMLVGVDGFGVYQTSRKAKGEVHLLFDANEGPKGVLHGNGVYSVLVDSWQNIVVGTYSGGIDVARPVGSTTAIFKHTRNNLQSLINDHVNCVMQWSNDVLLMGTDDGVSIYNSASQTWKHVARGMVVLDICKTPDGRILVATYGNGVCEVSIDGQSRQVYSVANGTLEDNQVYKLLYDKDGNLWMGCLSGKIVEKTPSGLKHYNINNVQAMIQIPDGRIAVGTAYGLFLISDKGKGKIEEVKYYPDELHDASWYIFDLLANTRDDLWIATDGGGVYRYNLKNGKCKQISTKNGLPSNSVYNLTKDNTGRIWLGTENGLAFIHPDNDVEVANVSYCYGLEREYVRGAVANLSNGNILYGSVEGAVIINPKKIQKLNYSASLSILGARCFDGDEEEFNEEVHKMLQKNKLNLSYSQRTFEIFYEGINLRNQFDVAYQYKLGDGEWSQLTSNQSIRFENMEPGSRDLSIRCVSKTSGIVLDEKVIELSISQPWWNSWWMDILYFLLIFFAFVGAWRVYDLHSRYMRLVETKVEGLGNTELATARAESEDQTTHENVSEEEYEDESNDQPLDTSFVDSATKIILENLSDPDFTIDSLCREMAMSRTLFYVKLKSYTGKSPQDFIRVIRLERSASLLRSGRAVSDVSAMVGFDNPKYFSTVFKKYFGVSPSKYK